VAFSLRKGHPALNLKLHVNWRTALVEGKIILKLVLEFEIPRASFATRNDDERNHAPARNETSDGRILEGSGWIVDKPEVIPFRSYLRFGGNSGAMNVNACGGPFDSCPRTANSRACRSRIKKSNAGAYL
jgi:hypothetical protein